MNRRDPDGIFAAATTRARRVPFAFVLDAIAERRPYTRPMFGCTAVYVDETIVFVLRDRPTTPLDNGVWVATTKEHHASLRDELPSMRSIGVLGAGNETGWQLLPAEAADFEEGVLRACALVVAGDPRIGKVPKRRAKRRAVNGGARGRRRRRA